MATFGSTAAQDSSPEAIRYDHDVVYGEIDGTPLLLDIAHPPDRAEPRPAVIVIHGGCLEFPGTLAFPGRHLRREE